MYIDYTAHFAREYRKIPREIFRLAREKEIIFRQNPFDVRLKTHKLHGKFGDYYSFSINYSYRIVFQFINNAHARFVAIGTHDIYH